ncbi:hypothetical protein CLOM_g1630 [Closterium sp. NIES-68]|nr:hypothetical protein CLOM_g1630 [Closterium sp. NIES-68]
MVPELQAWAVGTAVEGAEGEEADLAAATSMEAVVMEDMAATTMATSVGAVDLMANATFATRPATSSVSTKSEADGGGDHGKQSDTKSDSKDLELLELSTSSPLWTSTLA